MRNVGLRCPNCLRVDNVQKVSAIVAAGTSADTYAGYADGIGYTPYGPVITDDYITINARRQTALSRLLSPPIRPGGGGFFSNPQFAGQALAGLIVMIIVGLVSGYMEFFMITTDPTSILSFTSLVLAGITIFCFGCPVWFIFRLWSRRIEAKAQMPHWQRAMAKWQYLYYCHRCDGVFLPGQPFLMPATHIMEFLYSPWQA